MAVRDTIQVGDPRLKAPNKSVTNVRDSKVKRVVQDLIDTMVKNDLIGMAAPQIGENYKIFITHPRKTEARPKDITDVLRVYINPKIVYESSEETIIYEGCGSVVGIFGPVKRSKVVSVEATDLRGKKFQLKADGLLARVIHHEMDHLKGIEFIQKVYDYALLKNKEFYLKDIKMSSMQIENSKIALVKYRKL